MAETKTAGRRARPPKTEAQTEQPPREEAHESAPRDHVCNVAFCPIGLALSTVQGAAPDVLEHLLRATQEFLLAAKAVIDQRASDFEDEPEDGSLRRIEIT
ncbi:MAG TPA: hypothetical protein VFR44_11075 [Actinomycetota bacterium]|nr:hypothetical protein [Actinomycetota bacterium]